MEIKPFLTTTTVTMLGPCRFRIDDFTVIVPTPSQYLSFLQQLLFNLSFFKASKLQLYEDLLRIILSTYTGG